MIKSIHLENFNTFNKKIELYLDADNRIKKFPTNISNNILKTCVIFGPNNTGKTQIIKGIKAIKKTLLNISNPITPNLFTNDNTSKLGIKFNYNNNDYNYEFWKNLNDGYVYEKFSLINKNKEEIIFIKDTLKKTYSCKNDKNLEKAMKNTSNSNILIYTINTENFKLLDKIKNILNEIANKIEIIDMNKINDTKTIELLKNKNNRNEKIVSFIKNADLFLENFYYDDEASLLKGDTFNKIIETNQNNHKIDQLKLVSVYNGYKVPSAFFDSLGTAKIAALASYIIEALEEGKYLFIDELDSSLHFKLTRAIISMFHSNLNEKAQLVCTLHDISLLDIKNLFRKDQIWFTDKNKEGATLFSLKEFSYDETGVRETSDIQEKYKKGILGAIPEPDLIATLLDFDNE
ncbi:MAG: ATP-binding protein [Bacilli bacterium]|nr:ATP-binding protein [Bacilli bacterium]